MVPPAAKPAGVPLALRVELLEEVFELVPALGPLSTLLTADALPAAPLALPTPDEALAKCLRDGGPCTSAAERATREATIDRLKVARQALADAGDAAMAASVGAKIAAEEAALA